jgi:hypothetical protein
MVIGSTSGRLKQSGQDEAGRWIYMTLRTRENRPVTIICTYQVIDVDPRSTKVGPTTYGTQLHAYYRFEGRHNPENLRNHHSNDLSNLIKERQNLEEAVGDLTVNDVLGQD